jgi:hypothetical protein
MILYLSDLSGREWSILEPLIPSTKSGWYPHSWEMPLILNGIFSVLCSDYAWCILLH